MNFTRVNPLSWGLKALLTSDQANALDIDHAKAINGDDGSTHTPSSAITILGSNGVVFDCHVGGTWAAAVTFATGSSLALLGTSVQVGDGSHNTIFTVYDGSGLLGLSGASISLMSGALLAHNGTTHLGGHDHHVVGGGWLAVDATGRLKVASGGFLDLLAGSTTTLDGTLDASDLSIVNLGGQVNLLATSVAELKASAVLSLYGASTLKSSGTFVTVSGSTFTLGGAMTITATGAIATTGAGSITVTSGGSLAVNSGATATINGTLAGSITRTAAVTRSGSTANEYLRIASGSDSNSTYSPTFDVLFVNITGSKTYKIDDGSQGQVIRLAVNGVLGAAELTVADSGSSVICMLSESVMNVSAKKGGHVDLVWHAGAWRVLGGYGLYTP